MDFPHFAQFAVYNTMQQMHLQCIADMDCKICGLFAHLYLGEFGFDDVALEDKDIGR